MLLTPVRFCSTFCIIVINAALVLFDLGLKLSKTVIKANIK